MSDAAYAALEAFFGLDALNVVDVPPVVETVTPASDIDPDYAFFAVCRPDLAAIDGPRKIGAKVARLSFEAQFNREATMIKLDLIAARRIADRHAA